MAAARTTFDLSGMSSARAMEASRDTNCCTKCDETERFLESIRSFPNRSQVDLRTENSVEHKALDIHIAKAISTALDKLDITEAVVTSAE